MPATTPELALPYPIPDDNVDVPRDIKALADALEARLGGGGGTGGGPLVAAPVLDVGIAGQIRAGRQLTAADFTALGLAAPAGLWNLSDLTDASGNARALTNKGTVPFGVGINGAAATAAQFAGSTAQALYRADAGAGDPFRIAAGSWGAWTRTAKRGTFQQVVDKYGLAAQNAYKVQIQDTNIASAYISSDGTANYRVDGTSDVADDRWHFLVGSYDGTALRIYVDGLLEAAASLSVGIFSGSSPLNIGGSGAGAATNAASPHYGRVDEAFVTADVLSEDQVRNLYCAKIAHGYATTPKQVSLAVTRRKRGSAFAVADFPAQPVRLYNFTAGALTDQGSGAVPLTNNGGAVSVASPDGTSGGAFSFSGAQSLNGTDTGLPAALTARSYGCWFKTAVQGAMGLMGWGVVTTADARLLVGATTAGIVTAKSGADTLLGPYVADGQWHFVTVTEDNAAGDGVKRKLYVDGRMVAGSTVMNTLTLGGGNARVGAVQDGSAGFIGQVDGVFISGSALTATDIAALYAKGSQALTPSPKNAGDHVEAMDATNVLATFDTLDTTSLVDMGVQA